MTVALSRMALTGVVRREEFMLRVARAFADYGKVVTDRTTGSDRSLFLVRVMLDGAGPAPDAVLSTALAMGIPDAFVISR